MDNYQISNSELNERYMFIEGLLLYPGVLTLEEQDEINGIDKEVGLFLLKKRFGNVPYEIIDSYKAGKVTLVWVMEYLQQKEESFRFKLESIICDEKDRVKSVILEKGLERIYKSTIKNSVIKMYIRN